MQTVRIFISSPGDVKEERAKARRVIEELQRHYGTAVTLEPVLWEDLALPATASFQESIDVILNRRPIDIAVFIIWSRLGSPLGPNVTRPDGTPYRSGTEREFDIMLAAFQQSGQKSPIILAYTRRDDTAFSRHLATQAPSQLDELISQRKLADTFIRETFLDNQGHYVRAYHSYPEPISFALRLRTHLRQILDELLTIDFATTQWLQEPYRGLLVFETEHAPIFHGRDEEVCDLLERLREQERAGCAFAVVVGASGSGKSSLARAGVAASLTRHTDDEGVKEWRDVALVPGVRCGDLFVSLSRTLAEKMPELRNSAQDLDDIARGLATDPVLTMKLGILPAFARASATAGGPVRLLLILDQMEELWTDRNITADIRERFFAAIESLARSGCVVVLATLRSDFYAQAQQSAVFLRLKGDRGHFDLAPPSTAALQRLIVEPARLSGLRFERDDRTGRSLDQLILEDATRDPAALPLLQYVLSELYYQRDEERRLLTFQAYARLGGVEGALGQRAAETCSKLPEQVHASIDQILPLLVTVDGDQAAARRRAPLSELFANPSRQTLTEALIDARFLTTDQQDGTSIASLAHEALLRSWKEVADWIDANRELLQIRTRIEQSQLRWQQLNDPSLLLNPGLPLMEGERLLKQAAGLLSSETKGYIQSSLAHNSIQKTQARRIRHTILATLTSLTTIAIVVGMIAWRYYSKADQQGKVVSKREHEAVEAAKDLRRRAAQNAFQHALSEESAGRLENSYRDLFLAWNLADSDDPLQPSYQRILEDRLSAGGRALGLTMRHDDPVVTAAYSPDGRRLLTASLEYGTSGTIYLWDCSTGILVATIPEPRSQVTSTPFSPDGTRFVTWTTDVAQQWDTLSGAPIGKPIRGEGLFESVSYSPDGSVMITLCRDFDGGGVVQQWNTTTSLEVGTSSRDQYQFLSVVVSPDNTRLMTGSFGHQARLWSLRTGAPVGEPMGHDDMVRIVAFSPDGTRVLTGSNDKSVKLWNGQTGAPIGEAMIHTGIVLKATFSPDGARVLTTFLKEGDVLCSQLWDGSMGTRIGELMSHGDWNWDVRFSPDGTRILAGSDVKTCQLWDAFTGKPVGEPMAHSDSVTGACFSPDGSCVVTSSKNHKAQVWDSWSGAPIGPQLHHDEAVTAAVFSPDGTSILTIADRKVRMWLAGIDVAPNKFMPHPVPGMRKRGLRYPNANLFSPDKDRILSITGRDDFDSAIAQLWDGRTGERIGSPMSHNAPISKAVFSSDGKSLATGAGSQLHLWSAESGALIGDVIVHQDDINDLDFTPDGDRVVSASVDKVACIWSARTGKRLCEPLAHKGSVYISRCSPDGSRFATVCQDDDGQQLMQLWDCRTGASLSTPILVGEDRYTTIKRLSFSPDAKRILTLTGGIARLWSSESGKSIGAGMVHQGSNTIIEFSKDGLKINSISFGEVEGGFAQAWDGLTGAPLGSSFALGKGVSGGIVGPDSRHLIAISNKDGVARIWDGSTGKPIGEPLRHINQIHCAEFSADGSIVATGSGDNTARLWDARTGISLGEPLRHFEAVRSVEFTEDGRLLCGVDDQSATLWDVSNYFAPRVPMAHWEHQVGFSFDHDSLKPLSPVEYESRQKQLARNSEWQMKTEAFAERRRDETRMLLLKWSTDHRHWYAVNFHYDRLSAVARELPEMRRESRLANVELGRWKKAVEQYRQDKLQRRESSELFLALVASGQNDDARRLSESLLDDDLQAGSTGEKDLVVWRLLHVPEMVEPQKLVAISERLSASAPENTLYLETLGAALYRAGRYEDSLLAMSKANELSKDKGPTIWVMSFLAMVHRQLSHVEDANHWQIKANQEIDRALSRTPSDPAYPGWTARLQYQWLREEMRSGQ